MQPDTLHNLRIVRVPIAVVSMFTIVTTAMGQDMPSSSPSGTLPSTLSAVEVTALADRYAKPASRTATRTNTPSLLTAQSIQIVPRALIDDQAALALTDAVRNVSGVQYDFGFNGAMEITVLGITGPGSVPRQPDRRQAVAPMPARVAT